jgi:SAM-dependent methyltransferase
MAPVDARTARRISRAHWDALAAAHGQDAVYDSEALVARADSLHDPEAAGVREAVGAVAGLDVLHLQCHIGFDAISLARRGARVAGADFSPASIEKARALARRCDAAVEFVEAEATALPPELHNRFDLVYATVGVIVWIDDLRARPARVRRARLVRRRRPSGRLHRVGLLRPLARRDRPRRARRGPADRAPRRAPGCRLRPPRRPPAARGRRPLPAAGGRRAAADPVHAVASKP